MPRLDRVRQLSNRPWEPSWFVALSCTVALALAFQGTRGIWEPDEGFYSNVAHGMLQTGDFWIPRLNGEAFLDKPPLVYWTISWGQWLLGSSEWGARLGHAFWFALSALFVGALAGEIWGRRCGPSGALRYALALGPFVAANVLTPDTPLTCCVAAMAWSAWRLSGNLERREPSGWNGLWLGLAAGLGLLAKGPALLVFAFPLGVFLLVRHGRGILQTGPFVALIVGSTLGSSWYLAIVQSLPGAASYLFDNQVRGRLWSGHYRRNGDLLGPLRVYLPVLLAGTLPWTGEVMNQVKGALKLGANLTHSGGWKRLPREFPTLLFFALTIVVPLLVFAGARSRLPLYILPAFPMLIVWVSRSPLRWTRSQASLWAGVLLSLKLVAGVFPSHTDSRRTAAELEAMGVGPETPLISVEDKRNGLAFYGFEQMSWARLWDKSYPFYSRPEPVESALGLVAPSDRVVLLVRTRLVSELRARLPGESFSCSTSELPSSRDSVLDCHAIEGRLAHLGEHREPTEPSS